MCVRVVLCHLVCALIVCVCVCVCVHIFVKYVCMISEVIAHVRSLDKFISNHILYCIVKRKKH